MITDKSRLVQCFLKHFSSISLSLPPASANGPDKVMSKFQFERIEVESVLKLLSSLDSKKATGHDKISARLLKSTAPAIARSLASLFNWSLNTGEFPSEWKHAVVTPVPKSGDNQLITNYRPISVLLTIAKVFERLVHQQLYSYMEHHYLPNDVQSGFRSQHCTPDVLLKTVDDWKKALDCLITAVDLFYSLARASQRVKSRSTHL